MFSKKVGVLDKIFGVKSDSMFKVSVGQGEDVKCGFSEDSSKLLLVSQN